MEQGFFPVGPAGDGVQIVEADQFVLFKVVQQFRAQRHHFAQRQVEGRFAMLLEAQAGGLQQVAAPDTVVTPQVDEALRPTGVGVAQTLDIAEGRRIRAGVVVGEGGVISQTHTQGKLDWFHAGRCSKALGRKKRGQCIAAATAHTMRGQIKENQILSRSRPYWK